jgi:hypothetical protein
VARKVPELCKAYTPGKADQDLSARLSRIEHIIEMALPQFCHENSPSSSLDGHPPMDITRGLSMAEEDSRSQAEEQDPNGGSFQSGKWYGNSASGSIVPGSLLEQVRKFAIGAHMSKPSIPSLYSSRAPFQLPAKWKQIRCFTTRQMGSQMSSTPLD